MLTLLLLRHAKSSWDDPELDDHERPLSKRGARDAPRLGAYIASEDLRPDLVLCSGAVRTRATLALVLAQLATPSPRVDFDDALYLAEPDALLDRLKQVRGADRVMIVGHNPGLHALALQLTGEGARKPIAALAMAFPTCALAVLTFESDAWSKLANAAGTLERFVTPKTLA